MVIYQMLLMQINKEMLLISLTVVLQILTNLVTLLKTRMEPVEFSHNNKLNTIYQKTHKISQMLTMIINKETHFPQVTNTTLRAVHISKTTLCNQVTRTDTQLCFLNKNTIYLNKDTLLCFRRKSQTMIFLKTHKTYLMWRTIISKET